MYIKDMVIFLMVSLFFYPAMVHAEAGYEATKGSISLQVKDLLQDSQVRGLNLYHCSSLVNLMTGRLKSDAFAACSIRPVEVIIHNRSDTTISLSSRSVRAKQVDEDAVKSLLRNITLLKDMPSATYYSSYYSALFLGPLFCVFATGGRIKTDNPTINTVIGIVTATSVIGYLALYKKRQESFDVALKNFKELLCVEDTLIKPGQSVRKVILFAEKDYSGFFKFVVFTEDKIPRVAFDVDIVV